MEPMRQGMRRGYTKQDMRRKMGSALALASVRPVVCATARCTVGRCHKFRDIRQVFAGTYRFRDEPAAMFRVCAGYAPDEILSRLKTTALNEVGPKALKVCVEGYASGGYAPGMKAHKVPGEHPAVKQVCARYASKPKQILGGNLILQNAPPMLPRAHQSRLRTYAPASMRRECQLDMRRRRFCKNSRRPRWMILGSRPWGYASKRMRQALVRN